MHGPPGILAHVPCTLTIVKLGPFLSDVIRLTMDDLELDIHGRDGGCGAVGQDTLEKLHRKKKLNTDDGEVTPFFGFPLL